VINAGRLDQRIKLQQRAMPATLNERGEDVSPWVDVDVGTADGMLWASADPRRGSEFFAAQQIQAEGPCLFQIRWRSGVHERMRVLWRDLPYAILSPPIDAYGSRESLDLYCASGVRDGQ
jgi:SPP1 family predicted phage head-tail adaptor